MSYVEKEGIRQPTGHLSYSSSLKTELLTTIRWHNNVTQCPLLGNGSENTFPKHTLSTIEGHPLLGNGPISMHF
jgi:hypothetical protein